MGDAAAPQQTAPEAGPEDGPGALPAIADDAALVVLDPSEADRAQAEALTEGLGRPIWALHPEQFGSDMLDEIADAGAVIVEWDLGVRLGLDVVAALVAEERTRLVRVALASPHPTRTMVTAAIRAGACTFLHKPYDAEEIVRRLLPRPGGGEGDAEAAAEGGVEP